MSEIELSQQGDNTPAAIPAATTSAGAMRLVDWSHEASAAYHLAKGLVHTPFAGSWRGDEMGAAAAILKGSEIGLTPVTALAAFDNIQGTPAPKAITLRALVQSHGHDLEIVEETDQRAVARYRRNGKGDWQTTDFTIDEAKQLGLTSKSNWQKQPRAMLVARVTSKAARLVASDVILGIGYSAEEVRDFAPEPRRHQPSPAPDAATSSAVDDAAGATHPEPDVQPSAGESPYLDTSSPLAKAMFAAMGDEGIGKDIAHDFLTTVTGREITSSKQLTEDDARQVLDYLKASGADA